jgi:hypothetical protein
LFGEVFLTRKLRTEYSGQDVILYSFANRNLEVTPLEGRPRYPFDRRLGDTYKTFVGKREGRRPIGRDRLRLEDNIRNNVKEIGWECVDWIHLA